MSRCFLLGSYLISTLNVGISHAQEPINAQASATQPSPGHFTLREQFRFTRLDTGNVRNDRRGHIDDFTLLSSLSYGVNTDISLNLRMPASYRDTSGPSTGTGDKFGAGDVTLLLKWRFFKHDSGPLDTVRLALLGGAEIRTGDAPFTNDAYNPVAGLAYTQIIGRHGLNGALIWTFTTDGAEEMPPAGTSSRRRSRRSQRRQKVVEVTAAGMTTADVMRYDAAYLYRLSPAEYSADTAGAWYAMLELNGAYETNGDNEILLAPGIMYEAATWVFELSAQLPAWQDLSKRPELEYGLVTGFRFSF